MQNGSELLNSQFAIRHSLLGLYVHIPFCEVKCRFCDFAAFPGRLGEIDRYMAALRLEMERHSGADLGSIFIGGGTPTVLNERQLQQLLTMIRRSFVWPSGIETTVECNPESTSLKKLESLRKGGVTRLSFGLQSTEERLLKTLGRLHDFPKFLEAYSTARAVGFDNLNVDLMYGLPGQTMSDWQRTIERVLELEPEHLSAYALSVEEKTAFGHAGILPDDDLQADMYEWAAERLEAAGFIHYEISNFARAGRECRHNLRYWQSEPYLGLGVSAASCDIQGLRKQNASSFNLYLEALETGRSPMVSEDLLPEPEKIGENIMLALRLKSGARLSPHAKDLYGPVLERYVLNGFLQQDADEMGYKPTRLGWRLSNQLFQELLAPPARSL